ncbi:unnamed protein product, partial [Meganyctiphanes norvegica]
MNQDLTRGFSISFYKITIVNMDVEVKHDNNNINESEESCHPNDILQNSTYETVKVKVNCDIEVNEEPMQIEDVGIQLKKEIEIYEEPIASTGERYLVKNDLTQTSREKSHQCSLCKESFSQTNQLYIHMSTHLQAVQVGAMGKLDFHPLSVTLHTGNDIYLCSQCDKAFSHIRLLKHHLRTHTGEKPYQ